jgi:hypothetical protein
VEVISVRDTAPRTPARTARAALFAAVAVALVTALRARSDGPRPGLVLLLAAGGLVALLARPLTGRERRLPALIGGLVGVQLVLRSVFLITSTGHLAHGSTGLFCSPATTGADSCLPTDRGGIALLAVQLLAGTAFAVWLRNIEAASWSLARLFGLGIARVIATVGAALAALTGIAPHPLRTPAVAPPTPPSSAAPGRLRLILFSRTRGRRGPPAAVRIRAFAGSHPRAVDRCRTAFSAALDGALTP